MQDLTSPEPEGEDWGSGREIEPSRIQWGERYFEEIAVLTATIDGVLYYEAAGLCRITAHSNPRKAVKDLGEPHQIKDLNISAAQRTVTWVTVGPNPMRKFVTREGANRLVLDSRVRGAQKIKHWLADDVMPSIEDTGGYGSPVTPLTLPDLSNLDPQTLALLGQVGQALTQTSQALIAQQQINATQALALDRAQSKADYVDVFVDGRQDATSFRVYCTQIEVPERKFREHLIVKGIIYKKPVGRRFSQSKGMWVTDHEYHPRSNYKKWFHLKDQPEAPRHYNDQMRTTLYVSPLGKVKLLEWLKRHPLGGAA